ncbi:hypothetical protein [Campylobacter sp.]|uniref:hypothetical protein n=1 Tax=Campylobacter sp. TaxID=205 RepID=UPI00403E7FA8
MKKSSFAANVDKFWAEFEKSVDEIKADLKAQNFEEAMKKTDQKLKFCLKEPFFMMGIAGDKVDLVLTPEGLKHRLFWLEFIQKQMPNSLKNKAICTLGKQRANRKTAIKMYDYDVAIEDVFVDAFIEDEKWLNLKIYNENLAKLLNEDENAAYNLIYILLDNAIGEIAVINLLNDLEISPNPLKEAISLADLPKFIDENFGEETSADPQKRFSLYELQPQSNKIREDVFIGGTCLIGLINEYLDARSEIYEEAFENEIKICFLAIDHGGDAKRGFELRSNIEDEIENINQEWLVHIGGATGEGFAYIDLICFDEEKLKILVEILSKKYDTDIKIYDFKRD